MFHGPEHVPALPHHSRKKSQMYVFEHMRKRLNFSLTIYHLNSDQGSQARGPQAAYDPQIVCMRPASVILKY